MSASIDRALRAAKAALKAGNPVQAVQALTAEMARFPGNPRLVQGLAEVQAARTGLPAKPFGPAHLQRLMRVRAAAGPQAAAEEAQLASLVDPASALAAGVFGSFLLDLGQPEAAIAPLRAALKRDPKDPQAAVNLAIALRQAGLGPEAVEAAETAVARHPGLGHARVALALALVEDGRPAEGAQVLRALIAENPRAADLQYELGKALFAAQDFDAARAAQEAAVALEPRHDGALNELGSALLLAGDFAGAQAIFRRAIDTHPNSAAGYYNLVRAADLPADDPLVAQMERLAASSPRLSDRALLNFALFKVLDDAGQPDAAFAALKRGNDARRQEFPYDAAQEAAFFADLKARHWAPDAGVSAPPAPPRPIFILGMMRSGTTLMEQIVSAHSQVYGAGELDYLGKAVMAEMRRHSGPIDRAGMARIREAYLSRLTALPGDAPVVVDKMPANFALVGVILRALPEARIIHMRRDPIAVCWSIYQKNFSGGRQRFTNDLGDIAAYYDHYADYLAFAEAKAPGALIHVDYAELTKTPEPVIRRVLAACDLPFEEACLAPEKNHRTIQTASYRQARSGIYQGSSDKWRGYGPWLKPLIDHFAP